MDIKKLDELYKLYRFQILPIENNKLRVYSYSSKYFSNADVIVIAEIGSEELKKVTSQIENLGFSVKIRNYKTIIEAEENLFDGFFDIIKSNDNLKKSYKEYTEKIEKVIFGKYEFIKSEYHDIENAQLRNDNIVTTILENLNKKGPVLILLEAPAGFGKTSTSYEVLKFFSEDSKSKRIPLFTELSRNRQASIFKYVLYDEINRRFTGLSLELIIKQIIDGRIPVIIDGFDELLKPKSIDRTEDRFEDAEPMLETIKELLQGNAKIILTTRRTAVFADDDFFKWLENNNGKFSFYRYSISDPTIINWISPTREKALQKVGLNLKSISNPVLLTYLRSMNDEQFEKCLDNIDIIIEDYTTKLMERENERQDLNMTVDEQKTILKIISNHFTNSDITSESKEIIEKKILESEQNLLFKIQDRFPASNRPTIDQLINKLTIHAFLDRKSDSEHQIGFVNDFILGSFVGSNLIDDEKWFGTERFIDFILTAYIPRSTNTKRQIYMLLNKELIGYLNIQKQVFIDNYLFGGINREIKNDFFKDLEFRSSFNNSNGITDCIFSDCQFYDIDFEKESRYTTKTYFINCHFFDCKFIGDNLLEKEISFINCHFEPSNEISKYDFKPQDTAKKDETDDVNYYEKKVLEKFWQKGKNNFMPFKRIGTLRLGIPSEEIEFIDEAINSLIKRGIIIPRGGQYSVQLNVQHINEIKTILGR